MSRITKIEYYIIKCLCDESHQISPDEAYIWSTTGCGSCGYGGATHIEFTCPTTKKRVKVEQAEY